MAYRKMLTTRIRLAIDVLSKLAISICLTLKWSLFYAYTTMLPVHHCVVWQIGEWVIGRDMQRGVSFAWLI